jgi:hypothetical protein
VSERQLDHCILRSDNDPKEAKKADVRRLINVPQERSRATTTVHSLSSSQSIVTTCTQCSVAVLNLFLTPISPMQSWKKRKRMAMTPAASNPASGSLYRSRMRCLDRIGKRHVYRVGLDCVERRQRGRMRIIAAVVGLGKGGEAWMRGTLYL